MSLFSDQLYPGMFAQIRITTQSHENALIIPKSSLLYQDKESIVFILEKNLVKRKVIQTGISEDEKIEVLSGLSPKDSIVIVGQHSLKDGSKIKIVK